MSPVQTTRNRHSPAPVPQVQASTVPATIPNVSFCIQPPLDGPTQLPLARRPPRRAPFTQALIPHQPDRPDMNHRGVCRSGSDARSLAVRATDGGSR